MLLSEWREFPSAPCLAGKRNLMTARVSILLKSRASRYASELVSFLVGLRTYQHPDILIFFFLLISLLLSIETYIPCSGAFIKLRKQRSVSSCLISLVMSDHLEYLCSYWTDVHEILYLRILRKIVEKIQDSLK